MPAEGVDQQGPQQALPTIGGGRYKLASKLGEGGMAVVYKGWDTKLKVWRAVKVLLPEFSRRKKLRKRFENEALTMAKLQHRNVVGVFDVGTDEALPYIVMELATGGCLIDWVQEHGAMPPRMALDVTMQVCKGIGASHELGVVHRDIKPHNVLITKRGVCKVTDFGIAQTDEGGGMTKTGSVMGTLGYMAPEQRTNAKNVDQRADVYGIGATLYKLVTGGAVADLFLAEHDATMLEGVPDELVPVLLKATAYKPERRHATVSELAKELHNTKKDLPPDSQTAPSLVMAPGPSRSASGDAQAEFSQPTFPEIAEILGEEFPEPVRTGDEPASDTDERKRKAADALPYFMPQMDERKKKAWGEKTDNSELPSYLDEPATIDPDQRGGIVLGVDENSRQQAAEAREAAMEAGLIDEHGRTMRDGEAHGEKRPGTLEDLEEELSPWEMFKAAVIAILVASKKPIAAFAIPIGGLLIISSITIGTAAITVNQAETAATARQYALYRILESENRIVQDLIALGANEVMLTELYLDFEEAGGEPDKLLAAERLLGHLEQQATFQMSGSHSGVKRQHKKKMVRTRWEKISYAYVQYSDAMLAWELAADTRRGRLAVGVGAADAP